jgi:hypothetical protein
VGENVNAERQVILKAKMALSILVNWVKDPPDDA